MTALDVRVQQGFITAGIPAELVKELLEAFAEAKRRFYRDDLRPSEIEGARFSEAVFRILEWATTKMDERYAGSSMHLHSSLRSLDKDEPLFAAPPSPGAAGKGGAPAYPDAFRWWVGGLIRHAKACTLLFAPYVNSYKRYRAGSFAPTRIAWSIDNRTVGFRIVG